MKTINNILQYFSDKPGSKHFRKALYILVGGLTLTITDGIYTHHHVEKNEKREFLLICKDIKIKINSRLDANAMLLLSGSALFSASDSVTRQEWKDFHDKLETDKNLPGILGMGYAMIVPKTQIQQHTQNINKAGFPEYTLKPAGEREVFTSIVYLEPFEGRNLRAFGFDMYSESVRRMAMDQSCDYNLPTLSGKVELMQETNQDFQPGTLMYVPVYRKGMPIKTKQERRAAIQGWVYSPHRMHDLMNGILGRFDLLQQNRIQLQIFDGDSILTSAELYNNQKNDAINPNDSNNLTVNIPLSFNGRNWSLYFTQPPKPFSFLNNLTFIILISGVTISFLAFGLSLSIFETVERAKKIASRLTADLRESESRFRVLIEWTPEAIVVHRNNKIIFANPAAIEMVGGGSSDIITGRDIYEFVHPDYYQLVKDGIDNTLNDRIKEPRVEWKFLKLDGTIIDVELFGTPIKFDGEPAIHVAMRDITERKLNEEQIMIKNKELIKLNTDKDLFMSILAHDLKSPFNSLLGFSELLVENIHNYNSVKIEKLVNYINISAKGAFNLLENLLIWTRSQSGKFTFEPQEMLLSGIWQNISVNMKLSADIKNIAINYNAPPEILVYSDVNLLSTVLRNLISNAIKFTSKGGQIEINAKQVSGEVIITVSDNGSGISKELIEKLFNGTQLKSTKGTENEVGTGLGLMICKEFIEKHNGKFWVNSEFGKGAAFSFSLPHNSKSVIINE